MKKKKEVDKNEPVRITLRIPKSLHSNLEEMSWDSRRSLNSLIITMLKQHYLSIRSLDIKELMKELDYTK